MQDKNKIICDKVIADVKIFNALERFVYMFDVA